MGPRRFVVAAMAIAATLVANAGPAQAATDHRTVGTAANPAPVRPYRTVDLGTLGGDEATPNAIGAQGWVVGNSTLASGDPRGFLWRDGHMTNLGVLNGDTESEATDINASGQIVGSSFRTGRGWRAVLWSQGRMIDLGTFGFAWSRATAISDNGTIVGTVSTGDSAGGRAFRLRNGRFTVLPGIPGAFSPITTALDVNDAGTVVGSGNNALQLLRWDGDVPTKLDETSGITSRFDVAAINRGGDIVATRYTSHLPFISLWLGGVRHTPVPLPSTNIGCYASAINDLREFVGSCANGSYLDIADTTVIDLSLHGISPNSGLFDLNNRGQIVGVVINDTGAHATLFQP